MTMDFVGQAAHSCRSHYVEAAWCGCWGQNDSDVVYFPLKSRIIKNHTHLPGSNLRVFMYVNGFSSLSTANATCAEVRAASSMLYTTFNPPLRILSVITLRIMPAFPLSLSLQQQCHIGWLAIWPPLLLLLWKVPLVIEKVQNWLSSGEQRVFVIGMYLREKTRNWGTYIQKWVIWLQSVLGPS